MGHIRDTLYGKIYRKVMPLKCGSSSVILPSSWLHREASKLGLAYPSKVPMVEISEHLDGTLVLRAVKEAPQ